MSWWMRMKSSSFERKGGWFTIAVQLGHGWTMHSISLGYRRKVLSQDDACAFSRLGLRGAGFQPVVALASSRHALAKNFPSRARTALAALPPSDALHPRVDPHPPCELALLGCADANDPISDSTLATNGCTHCLARMRPSRNRIEPRRNRMQTEPKQRPAQPSTASGQPNSAMLLPRTPVLDASMDGMHPKMDRNLASRGCTPILEWMQMHPFEDRMEACEDSLLKAEPMHLPRFA